MIGARTAVITIAHGRHEHLIGQAWGLARQTRRADVHVVVAMDDREIQRLAREHIPGALTPALTGVGDDLPLSAARNAGATAALGAGADHLIFLDVDCIPGPDTVARYHQVLLDVTSRPGPVVVCGEVAYLPRVDHPASYRTVELHRRARPHPARPRPSSDETLWDGDVRLFWSLSFALTARDWLRLGGFSEDYVGYGGEDTDFGQRLSAADGALVWAGGAPAYHQHHEVEAPPTRHLRSIVANANLFHDRWGWFPMEGWLDEFARQGLARHDPSAQRWVVTAAR